MKNSDLKLSAIEVHSDGSKRTLHFGNLTTLRWSVAMTNEQSERFLDLNDVTFSLGGSRDHLVFIQLKDSSVGPVYYFELRELNLLKDHLSQEVLYYLSPIIQKSLGVQRRKWVYSVASIVVLIVLLFSVFVGSKRIFGSLGQHIPLRWEEKISAPFLNDRYSSKQKALVQKLESDLAAVTSGLGAPVHLHLSEKKSPNAYASLGGNIFIHKGLIQALHSSDELISVLAHEMIHVRERHVVRSVSQGLGLFATFQLLLGDVSGVAATLFDQGAELFQLSYSRELEEEADDKAIEYLAQQGFAPRLAEALERIRDQNRSNQGSDVEAQIRNQLSRIEMLSSHPELDVRIQKLKLKEKELFFKVAKKVKLPLDFVKLQNDVKEEF